MHLCIAFDCIYPWTKGGAERWYRVLADELVAQGHQVTYLTRLQWDEADPPRIPGVEVIAVSPSTGLYTGSGRRRIAPALRFAAGVFIHLARRGSRYHAVHLCQAPLFSVAAAWLAVRPRRRPLGVDWFEVWSAAYWVAYAGSLVGRVGYAVQSTAIRMSTVAFAYSQLSADRLSARAHQAGSVVQCPGLVYTRGHEDTPPPAPRVGRAPGPIRLVALGRLIPEKRTHLIVELVAELARRGTDAKAEIYGDGPDRETLENAVAEHGVGELVTLHGFAPQADIDRALADADCLVHPSAREGFGLVLVESFELGTPVVAAHGEDNAAVELVEPGVNGYLAEPCPPALADAVLKVMEAGTALRRSTRTWFEQESSRRSARTSARLIEAAYAARLDRRTLTG